jgi:hypothetical protein
MNRNWIVVASAEHVRRGAGGGFVQACHGKRGSLARMTPSDHVICYSPTATFGRKDRLRAFTAFGIVDDREPYQVDMGGGFRPYRRDIGWLPACDAPIEPMLERLDLTAGRRNWGYQFRFGIIAIGEADAALIRASMNVALPQE